MMTLHIVSFIVGLVKVGEKKNISFPFRNEDVRPSGNTLKKGQMHHIELFDKKNRSYYWLG